MYAGLCMMYCMIMMMTIACIGVAFMSKNNQCELHCWMSVSPAFMNDGLYWRITACIGESWHVLALWCCIPKLALWWGFCLIITTCIELVSVSLHCTMINNLMFWCWKSMSYIMMSDMCQVHIFLYVDVLCGVMNEVKMWGKEV